MFQGRPQLLKMHIDLMLGTELDLLHTISSVNIIMTIKSLVNKNFTRTARVFQDLTSIYQVVEGPIRYIYLKIH